MVHDVLGKTQRFVGLPALGDIFDESLNLIRAVIDLAEAYATIDKTAVAASVAAFELLPTGRLSHLCKHLFSGIFSDTERLPKTMPVDIRDHLILRIIFEHLDQSGVNGQQLHFVGGTENAKRRIFKKMAIPFFRSVEGLFNLPGALCRSAYLVTMFFKKFPKDFRIVSGSLDDQEGPHANSVWQRDMPSRIDRDGQIHLG
jgi:hypothetical protein